MKGGEAWGTWMLPGLEGMSALMSGFCDFGSTGLDDVGSRGRRGDNMRKRAGVRGERLNNGREAMEGTESTNMQILDPGVKAPAVMSRVL